MYSQSDSAYKLSQLQYDYSKNAGNKYYMAAAIKSQATYFFLQGDYALALDALNQSWNLYKEIQDNSGMGAVLNNMGTVYWAQGLFSKALEYYKRSLAYKPVEDKYGIATTLLNIGTIYSTQGNSIKTIEYENQALNLFKEINYKPGIANCLHNLGMTYYEQNDYDRALKLVQESLKINEEIKDKSFTSSNLSGLGLIYRSLKDYPKALEYFVKSLQGFRENGERKEEAKSLIFIGELYLSQGVYAKAITYCMDGLGIARAINLLSEQKDACSCLYSANKKLKNESKALYYHEQQKIISDSLHFVETEKMLQQLEFEKKVLADSLSRAEKERLVQVAHQEEMQRKNEISNMAIGGGILLLIFAAGLYSRLSYIRKSKSIVEMERDRSDNLLLNILPQEIAQELKEKGTTEARGFEQVSILFSDFKEFTITAEKFSPQQLVTEINTCFKEFDLIMEKFGIEKIKTIGDAYMAAGGLPLISADSVKNTVLAGLENDPPTGGRPGQRSSSFIQRLEQSPCPCLCSSPTRFWYDTVNLPPMFCVITYILTSSATKLHQTFFLCPFLS